MTPVPPRPLHAAVVGLGAMGRNHVRVYDEVPGVALVGLVDSDPARVASAIRRTDARGYTSVAEMLRSESIDLASVVVPTQLHHEVAAALLSAGVAVLVEKPISLRVDEGEDLIARARRAGCVFTVGHIERFNPAVLELKRRLDAGELGHAFQIHATRVGPFPDRVRDVGVVIDLATHDLDLMRYLLGQEVTHVFAETGRNIHTLHEDMVVGVLGFENGTIGLLDINWLTPTKRRTLTITGTKGMFLVDYLAQDLTFFENGLYPVQWQQLSAVRGVSEGAATRLALHREEPLRAELCAFVDAVRYGTSVAISGDEALEALRLAQAVVTAAQRHSVVSLTYAAV